METKRIDNYCIVRIDKGEEIVATLKQVCSEQGISLGRVTGIGAADSVKIGVFETGTKTYLSKDFTGDMEITSLCGNVTRKEGEVYLHLHVTLADKELKAFGGHLNAASVSATCECFIEILHGSVDRVFNEGIGLNLMRY